jgi:hypothetical protein
MNPIISEAIQNKRILELRYHRYSRVVEPHAYGRDKSGEEVLRCYQISGGSESGERTGWKLLKVGEASSLHITGDSFTQRPDYRRNDKDMEYIFCQL